jgi:hypothetical protein
VLDSIIFDTNHHGVVATDVYFWLGVSQFFEGESKKVYALYKSERDRVAVIWGPTYEEVAASTAVGIRVRQIRCILVNV